MLLGNPPLPSFGSSYIVTGSVAHPRTHYWPSPACNDLWLQLITVSLCDGLIRRMYVGRERENSAHERGRAYFARPSRVSQLSLALDLATSHYLSSSPVLTPEDDVVVVL